MKLVWVYVFSVFILRWVDGFDLFEREFHRHEVPANSFDFLGQPKVPQPDVPAHGVGFLGHHRMSEHDVSAHGHHLRGRFIPFTLPPFLIGPNLFKDLDVIELGWMGHPDNTGQLVSKNASDDASTQGPLMVGITIVKEAVEVGAVCLDGTPPAYHLDKGFGSGEDSWLVHLEGGGWCSTIRECTYRKKTARGSSDHMEKETPFIGILSSDPNQNPDFYNWNRVKIRYCDGASFSGDSENEAENLYFRGQRIWSAVMKQLMSNGMASASQALLSGCSAGGLSSILHCDEFQGLFPSSTKVKCFSDAGLFLDALDVSGKRTLRSLYGNVVSLQGVKKSLPTSCTSHMDPTLCFFPENRVAQIETPLFLLNAAYDSWQIQVSLTPQSADPNGNWSECRLNYTTCDASQIQFFQDFRNQMLESIKTFSASKQNGLFINSCFAHCQSERADTWFGKASPTIENKGIAQSVGDWYFDRSEVKTIDCPFPCDKTCHNLIFKSQFRDN